MRFFKKIQDWSLIKSERIRRILCFFVTKINPRSLRSWCVKETEESISRVDDAPRSERSWIHLFNKEAKNLFSDSFGSWIFKETHPNPEVMTYNKVSCSLEACQMYKFTQGRGTLELNRLICRFLCNATRHLSGSYFCNIFFSSLAPLVCQF